MALTGSMLVLQIARPFRRLPYFFREHHLRPSMDQAHRLFFPGLFLCLRASSAGAFRSPTLTCESMRHVLRTSHSPSLLDTIFGIIFRD